MKSIFWTIIVIVITAIAVLLYGWLVLGWFQVVETPVVTTGEEMTLSDEELAERSRRQNANIELMHKVEDTMIALELYGLEYGTLPQSVATIVPEYLPEEFPGVSYDRISDYEAMISIPLDEVDTDVMNSDDGQNDMLFELAIELPKDLVPVTD